jgi:hypothetical protein
MAAFMLNGRTFSVDDFELERRGPRLFDSWRARTSLDNPLGKFDVVLDDPPDEELVKHLNELATAVSTEYDAILNIVYDDYLRASEQKYWMKGCGVPLRLREHRVARYVESRVISVRRKQNGAISAEVSLRPQWEPEHGLRLLLVNGRFASFPR